MKKKLKVLTALLISSITAISMFGCSSNNKTKEGKVTVRLNEVTRSVFYAPMYVAMKEGYFAENGIEIDLQTGQGADKTMQAVLSKSADIGFCGPEQTIYINNQGREITRYFLDSLPKKMVPSWLDELRKIILSGKILKEKVL